MTTNHKLIPPSICSPLLWQDIQHSLPWKRHKWLHPYINPFITSFPLKSEGNTRQLDPFASNSNSQEHKLIRPLIFDTYFLLSTLACHSACLNISSWSDNMRVYTNTCALPRPSHPSCFVDYHSLLWGSGVISTIDEPRGAFTCRSSTLAIFVDSDPFHGLLLNFGVPKRFPWLSNPGMSTLSILVDSWPFHGVLLTVLGSQSDFHGCRTSRCAYVSVINARSFGRFAPFRGLLLTVLNLEAIFTKANALLINTHGFCRF